MSRKAAAVVEAVKSYRSADETPRFVRDVTALSRYRNQYGNQTFIVDATLGCDLDAFKEYFAQEHDISMPSSYDGLFLWKDPQGNNDKATRLDRDYSGETLLFVEFKHAPIFSKWPTAEWISCMRSKTAEWMGDVMRRASRRNLRTRASYSCTRPGPTAVALSWISRIANV